MKQLIVALSFNVAQAGNTKVTKTVDISNLSDEQIVPTVLGVTVGCSLGNQNGKEFQ